MGEAEEEAQEEAATLGSHWVAGVWASGERSETRGGAATRQAGRDG